MRWIVAFLRARAIRRQERAQAEKLFEAALDCLISAAEDLYWIDGRGRKRHQKVMHVDSSGIQLRQTPRDPLAFAEKIPGTIEARARAIIAAVNVKPPTDRRFFTRRQLIFR